MAAGFLWALVAGDGVHGLKGVDAVSDANSFPDVNVVFILAVAVHVSSPLSAAYWSDLTLGRYGLSKWCGATAIAGAALFALSRLFI